MVIQMSELTLAARAHQTEIWDPYGAKRRLSLVLVPRSRGWVGPLHSGDVQMDAEVTGPYGVNGKVGIGQP